MANPQPVSDPDGQWVLQAEHSDEFCAPTLDLTKWNSDVGDWGNWSWEPEHAWVQDGSLHLRMQYQEHMRDGRSLFYTSGIVKSRAAPIRYGYFEARIRAAQRFPGVSPAFWLYRDEKELWTEIDITEITEHADNGRLIDTNTHVFKHPQLQKGQTVHEVRTWESPWDPRGAFHVYGCRWDATEIAWYIDGQRVATRRNDYWHQPLDVVLSFGLRDPLCGGPSREGFPTAFEVDYVRVWTPAGTNAMPSAPGDHRPDETGGSAGERARDDAFSAGREKRSLR